MKQMTLDVNKEIIEEKAKIPPKVFADTEIQLTERNYEDEGQQVDIIL